MTQIEITIKDAAEHAAQSAIDAFGVYCLPSAQIAWDFLNEQVYIGEEDGGIERPMYLPDTMPNMFRTEDWDAVNRIRRAA